MRWVASDGEGGTVAFLSPLEPSRVTGFYGAFATLRIEFHAYLEQLLRDDPYHLSIAKMIMKDARVGGAWGVASGLRYW